jgi:hypothetical protein
MSDTKLITAVEVLGPPEKRPDRWGRKSSEWRVPVRYTVEDGSVIETGDWFSTRKAALAKGGALPHGYSALYDAEGNHIGFQLKISLRA